MHYLNVNVLFADASNTDFTISMMKNNGNERAFLI